MSINSCPLCAAANSDPVLSIPKFPIHHVLDGDHAPTDRDYAILDIVECAECGHVYNRAFDEGRFDDLYGCAIQTNKPVSSTMSQAIIDARDFIMEGRAHSPSVMEIGGGSGDLSILLAESARDVVLVEPNKGLSQDIFSGKGVRLISEIFPAEKIAETFDVVACRQVLEHVVDTHGFLSAMRERLVDNGEAYIEVPCMEYIEKTRSPFDFHYDHVHYFKRPLLEAAMRRVGLNPGRSYEIKDGHDIGYIAPISAADGAAMAKFKSASPLGPKLRERLDVAKSRLATITGQTALYGATVYSQSFMGLFPEFDKILKIFDDTESYHGQNAYGPDLVLPVCGSSAENLEDIDTVIIAAYLHDQVIGKKLRSLGFTGDLYTLRPDAVPENDLAMMPLLGA